MQSRDKIGRHNVDTGHEVTFKAGDFWGKGKVVTHGKDGSFVQEHDDSQAADFHEHQAVEHYSSSTYALRDNDESGENAHDKAGDAHEKARRAHVDGSADAAELSAAAKKASERADNLYDRRKIKSQASSAIDFQKLNFQFA